MNKIALRFAALSIAVGICAASSISAQTGTENTCWVPATANDSNIYPWYQVIRECGIDVSKVGGLNASELFALRGRAAEICQRWSNGRVSQLRQLMRQDLKNAMYREAMREAGDNYSERFGIQLGSSLTGLPTLPAEQELELQKTEREFASQCLADFESAFLIN